MDATPEQVEEIRARIEHIKAEMAAQRWQWYEDAEEELWGYVVPLVGLLDSLATRAAVAASHDDNTGGHHPLVTGECKKIVRDLAAYAPKQEEKDVPTT